MTQETANPSPVQPDIPPHLYVDSAETLRRAVRQLSAPRRLAVDTEADSLHHYFEKVCLIQISSPEGNYVIDPLAGLDLSDLFALLSQKRLVLHGADYDLRILRRMFGFRAQRVYDTSVAAQLLGYDSFGLAALIERHFDVVIPKSSQRADWSRRPLTDKMLAYAVGDTSRLLALADILEEELRQKGRVAWRRQACERLLEETAVDREDNQDERWRIRGWRKLKGGALLAILREVWSWRDSEGRRADLPTFKVLGNEPLLELATWVKEHPGVDPVRFPKAPRNLRGRRLEALRRALKRARALPPSDWPALPKPGPRPPGALSDGPTTDRIRKARNALATSLEIGPGFLAPNASLTAIVAAAPRTVDQLRRAGRLLPWQAEAVGESFLEILRKGDEQA